jgi:uncharacterized protein YndB with AHSA1/START domain
MSNSPSVNDILVVRRILPIPRDQVFAAWLDPKSLAQFMAPRPGWHATAEVDARVGGQFRIVMFFEGKDRPHSGKYLLIDPPRTLSFTWISQSTDMTPSEVTIDFLEHASGTELVLTHRKLPLTAIEAHREGWTAILGMLEGLK